MTDFTGAETEDLTKNKSSKKQAVDRSQALVKWAGGEAAATGVSAAMVAVGITTLVVPAVAVSVHVARNGTRPGLYAGRRMDTMKKKVYSVVETLWGKRERVRASVVCSRNDLNE